MPDHSHPDRPSHPDRRSLLRVALGAGAVVGAGGTGVLLRELTDRAKAPVPAIASEACCSEAAPAPEPPPDPFRDEGGGVADRRRAIEKSADFDLHYADDVIVAADRLAVLDSVAARLERAQRIIGHGHFNLVGFDEVLQHARRFPNIGAFPTAEIEFLEEVFARDSRELGFFGQKVLDDIRDRIPDRDVKKIAGTGHYLLKGAPLERYQQIRRDIGDSITLTSGVRGMVKQFQLYLSKAVTVDGNLSQAARSLAPPGHSHHARGDFDVGKVGLGAQNFTEDFAQTDEYRRLIDLGYVEIRYEPGNPFGVRHEPWHVKIV